MSLRLDDTEIAFPMPSGETNEGTDAENNEAAAQSDAAKSKTEDENAPPKDQIDMTKIIILGAGVLLIVFSFTVILLVATGSYGPVYNAPIAQMRGDMELEEMDGVLLQWKPEYEDLSSEEAKKLKNSFKSKLLKALEDEGVEVDDIEITELSPGPRKTIKKVLKQKRRKPQGRAASVIPEELSIDPGATGMLTAEMDQKVPTYTELTPDVQLVHVKYETKGVPAKNAPLFTAAHGQWNSVSNMIEARMASTGMNVHIDSMKPTNKFMDNVLDISTQNSKTTPAPAARYDPRTAATARQANVRDCGCDATGMFVTAPDILKCRCSGPCIDGTNVLIFGGVNNIFRQCVKICPAAYYAGVIDESGGIIEVINMGKGRLEAGGARKSLVPRNILFEDIRYKIKAPGQTISVTPAPTTAYSWNAGGAAQASTTASFWGSAWGGAPQASTTAYSWNAGGAWGGAPQASTTAYSWNAGGAAQASTSAYSWNAGGAAQASTTAYSWNAGGAAQASTTVSFWGSGWGGATQASTTASSWNAGGAPQASTTAYSWNAGGAAQASTTSYSWNAGGAPQASTTASSWNAGGAAQASTTASFWGSGWGGATQASTTASSWNAGGAPQASTTAYSWNAGGAPQASTTASSWNAGGAGGNTGWGQTTAWQSGAGAGAGGSAAGWGQASGGGGGGVVGGGGGGGAGQPSGTPKSAFTLFIHYKYDRYHDSMKDLTASKAKNLIRKIEPEVKKALESLEFVIHQAKVTQFIKPPASEGSIVVVDVVCDHGINIPIAVKVERTKVGVVPKKIELAMTKSPTARIRCFRYQKDFQNEMMKLMGRG